MGSRELEKLMIELGGGRMTRAAFLARIAGLGLTASATASVLAACGQEDEGAAGESPAPLDTTKPDSLTLYNWSDYMDPQVLKDFEDETGVSVNETYFDSNDALLAKLKAGATGYDVIVPTGWMVTVMMKSDLLQPLDMSLIPSFSGVMKAFQTPSYDPGDASGRYSVPYMFGRTGLDIRLDKVKGQITSWQSLWDPTYKDQIVMLADSRSVLEPALYLMGSDCNSTDREELEKAKDKMIEQKPLVQKYDAVPLRNIMTGSPITMGWDGDVVRAQQDLGENKAAFVAPAEGYSVWTDTFAVPKGANSPYWAHKLIDYLLVPEVSAHLSLFTGYQSPVREAASLITDPLLAAMQPTDEELAKAHAYEDVGEFQSVYDEMWRAIKSA
jgi:spermidine/putrescine transport system substrate-binding protein